MRDILAAYLPQIADALVWLALAAIAALAAYLRRVAAGSHDTRVQVLALAGARESEHMVQDLAPVAAEFKARSADGSLSGEDAAALHALALRQGEQAVRRMGGELTDALRAALDDAIRREVERGKATTPWAAGDGPQP